MGNRELVSMPTFRIPGVVTDTENWRFSIDGLVETPMKLNMQNLTSLPSVRVRDDFTCLEGWTVKGITWKGVRVSELLTLVSAKPTAKYAVFVAPEDYTQGLSIQRCMEPTTILAYELNDTPLRAEHGAPLRLVSRGQECFESVKWVHKMHLTDEHVEGSARNIALGRIASISSTERFMNHPW